MNANWTDPNFILGNVARGDNFYLRNDIVNKILIHTAHKGYISLQEFYDKAVKKPLIT